MPACRSQVLQACTYQPLFNAPNEHLNVGRQADVRRLFFPVNLPERGTRGVLSRATFELAGRDAWLDSSA